MAFIKLLFLILLVLPFARFLLYVVDKLMDEFSVLKKANDDGTMTDNRRYSKRTNLTKRRNRNRKRIR
ncbi:MAG: hypothetical protein ACI4KL_00145 [Lentihominibacter sp.]